MYKFFIFLIVFLFSFEVVYANSPLRDGLLVKGSGPEVYFMENGMKRWIKNPSVFSKYEFDWGKIVYVTDQELDMYPEGSVIDRFYRYPDGALLRGRGEYKVYLIDRGAKRWVQDIYTFENLDLNWNSILDVSKNKIKRIREGKPINVKSKIVRPDTVFIDTPKDIVEGVFVRFEFSATPAILDDKKIRFETFLEGVDKKWKYSYRKYRSINLPKKSGKYKFFVRARYLDGGVDLIPQKYEFTVKISPLFGDVKIYSVRSNKNNVDAEYISLKNKSKIPLNITNWSIESKKNNASYTIPKVYKIPRYPYDMEKIDVSLNPGAFAFIHSGKDFSSPGFRVNKCIGYLDDFNLSPSLPKICSAPTKDKYENLDQYCQNLINKTPNCQEPNVNSISVTNQCRSFIRSNFGYGNCVILNNRYYDFFKDEWRVYLGKTKSVWDEYQDEIILRDKNGLVVDIYNY